MLRLCIQNACTLNTIISQPILQKQITTKLKSFNPYSFALNRQYTIKITESEKSDVIYYGPLTPQIKGVKVFSLSSSVAGLLAQPIIINEAANIGSTSLIVALCSVVGFFTFVTPILLHLITKKYVIEMSYNPTTSTYKATTINFFLARKQLEFKPEDVEVPDVPGMFTTMIAKGKPLFIEARHFSDPLHYAKIMGYDKPLDFKLGETDTKKCK